MKGPTRYLNADLDLVAPFDLAPLAEALAQRGLCLFHVLPQQDGSWSTRLETAEPFLEPDLNIAAMLTAIEALEEPSKSQWSACTLRNFDIGYDCGDGPWGFNQQLSPATISRMAAVGATLVITLYPKIDSQASQAAVNILKKDKSIQSHIGQYKGNGYYLVDAPSLKEQLAEVKVSLTGDKGSVLVHCLLEMNKQKAWTLKEILKKEERTFA